MVDLLAEIEARLDFDEDLPCLDSAAVQRRLQRLAEQVALSHLVLPMTAKRALVIGALSAGRTVFEPAAHLFDASC